MADDAVALEIEQPETPDNEEIEQQPAPEAEGEDVVFGDEPAPAPDSDNATIRQLREALKEANKRAAAPPPPAQVEVGPKPTLESCEFDGDKFETELDAWKDREAQAKQQQAKAGETDQRFQQEWQRDHQSYQAKRGDLKFPDVDEVEGVATAVLSDPQQVTIVQVADNPALLLYALGKHPGKLAEIAAITNPLKLAKAITQLEGKLTVKPRSKAPNPEEIESGTASMSATKTDAHLEKLEKEATKTGDRSAIAAYRHSQRQKAK